MTPDETTANEEPITPQVFAHLVKLAQLEMEQAEADYLRRELNGQMKSIRQLSAIEVDEGVPIASHGVPYAAAQRPPLRGDEPRPSELADDILDGAPETDDRYVVVPDIPHQELT